MGQEIGTDLTLNVSVTGIEGVVKEVYIQEFLMEPENLPAWGMGSSSTLKANCPSAATFCGDGTVNGQEECDDANTDSDDGCSATCTIECGDGSVTGSEECDDGGTDPDDGCSATCTNECGDGSVTGAEECDDANTDLDDGCHNCICTEETCPEPTSGGGGSSGGSGESSGESSDDA